VFMKASDYEIKAVALQAYLLNNLRIQYQTNPIVIVGTEFKLSIFLCRNWTVV
jgi:hypothetical protein